ncbi:hypothetical protein [Alteromonas flava]|uniref:hypothetical protein n=1 Tax=Alteromonas flava TaxID=2048003 RepID=UPI001F0C0EE6|nr:hypothetical protein [Alteromonas flava]
MRLTNFFRKISIILVISFLMAGCAANRQPHIALDTNQLADTNKVFGVLVQYPEKAATTHIYGASCLLCYGVAAAMTSKLDDHLESQVSTEELASLKDLVFTRYFEKATNKDNVYWVELNGRLDNLPKFKKTQGYANRDFRSLRGKLGVDVLVVLQVDEHGAFRSFSGYIPNGDPKGYIKGTLYAVDLRSNAYVHYLPFSQYVQPEGYWDEPPTFPSVTTSYYQAVENIKMQIEKNL